jgi:hypothetical protein
MPKVSVQTTIKTTKPAAKKPAGKIVPKAKTSTKIKEEKKSVEKETTAKVLKADELMGG